MAALPFRRLLALLAFACAGTPVLADIYVVVSADSPVRSMSQADTVDLFMGRSRHFPNGDYALPFDHARNSPTRAVFYRLLTGMDMAQVNGHWARLMFSGQTMPPQPLPSEAAVLDVVRRYPGAIGYLDREPADKAVHVVLVLKEPR